MKKILAAVFMLAFINVEAQVDSSQLQLSRSFDRAFLQNSTGAKPTSNKISSFVIPASLLTYGIVALNNNQLRHLDISTSKEMREDQPHFKSNLDNYLQYAPAAAVYGLNLLNIKGKSNFADRTIMYALTNIISGAAVTGIKRWASVVRPDGSASTSFPSGHTTTAFAAAEFLHQEYKGSSPLLSYAGYAAATATGLLRMYNQKHFLSDVIAGAGIGMLSTKLVYLVYPSLKRKFFKNKSSGAIIVPTYSNGAAGLGMVYNFSH